MIGNSLKMLAGCSGTELARLIAEGDVSARETVEAHIARITQVNPSLNAMVVERFAAAREEADLADRQRQRGASLGLLHGVPITIKECLDLAGTPSTFGIPSRVHHNASADDRYVARMRAAGAIILGKTNVAQHLMYFESDNPIYGRTNNPWNLDRTAGGSSGGEAALIAADSVPLGLGTDLGGSVRVPAAFCGIASIKPTTGRAPDTGRWSIPIGQRAIVSQVGILARAVEDVAMGLSIINGGNAPMVEPPQPLGDYTTIDIAQLRIGYYVDDGVFQTAPAVRRAVLEAADILRQQGAQVGAWQPPATDRALNLFKGLLLADGGKGMREALGRDRRDPRIASLLMLAGRSRIFLGVLAGVLRLADQQSLAGGLRTFGHPDTAHYWRLVEEQMDYATQFAAAMERDGEPLDLLLCPAAALPAFTHGSTRDLLTAGSYTPLFNLLGYPAGVVPVTRVRTGEEVGRTASRDVVEKTALKVEQGSAGLPIGVQIVARPWREHVALAAMSAIERVARTHEEYPAHPSL